MVSLGALEQSHPTPPSGEGAHTRMLNTIPSGLGRPQGI